MIDTGTLTDGQIGAAFQALLGIEPREADVAVVRMLGGTVEVLAEFLWDHWMGEPETPTLEQVKTRVEAVT